MYVPVFGGKLVGSLAMVSGLIVLAFPITLIVSNFSRFYMAASGDEGEKAPTDETKDDLAEHLKTLAETDTLYRHALDSLSVAHSKYICVVEEMRKQLENMTNEESEASVSRVGLFQKALNFKRQTPLTVPVVPRVQVHNTQETLIAIPGMGPLLGAPNLRSLKNTDK